mgnify:CR=1 FL=1
MKKKMTIDTLARMTAEQFAHVDECFDGIDKRFDSVEGTLVELKDGQKRILDVLLEIPSKKAFERLDNKVQTFDARLMSVEKKVK